ncbi:MAG: hypothetical protein ACRC7N_09605 [Clostridium sp.]
MYNYNNKQSYNTSNKFNSVRYTDIVTPLCGCNTEPPIILPPPVTIPPITIPPVTIPPTTIPGATLSPPWYTFANQVKYTYGCCNLVRVNDLIPVEGGDYLLVINVCDNTIANALRQLLPETVSFGGVIVTITIFNACGQVVNVSNQAYTPQTLAKLICTALKCNPLFGGCVLTAGKIPPVGSIGDVAIIIDKAVVQFYNDDISDLCNNYNEVASKVFEEITNLKYPDNLTISFTTYDCDCALQKDIYC